MEFYYPNWLNDFWRICGTVFYDDRDHFVIPNEKRFDIQSVKGFCAEKGIALYDTATEVRRLKDNASDKFLEVVTPTDIAALLAQIPECRAVVTTGQKATDVLVGAFGCDEPRVGGRTPVTIAARQYDFWRMPSTSRAYPLPLKQKAEAYKLLFTTTNLL